MSIAHLVLLLLIGLTAGFVGGALGLGGGIIIVPALIYLLNFSQHEAQGTSLMVLLFPVGILAVVNYYRAGFIDWKLALILMVGVVIGSYFGSKVSINIPAETLRKIFGFFIVLVGIKMILGR
ncbi:MAG: sulfite exporter TauE/SafE family protein [Tenuifilum sp.]|uniref:sulfite exporter TauE/SafE family protein n=1 Tax=Tenuifilum sp. TaxID=2760880 RepID=UPI001B6A3C51|nr:sulfite exporter TauE/SafE family protein [Bacteroidales bacterium]HOK60245.1 sulfite exporter TauE/SafE family protein [Tenuifilum sp.]HOK86468.1 sulfite exporter TauE/SafE family protein [Tenuifilum sp.]HON70706.1 sulfite exporter TauE/SafE family protein [Tenuifilum sp.]HOU74162.1 sulfite exporter TauE/SafE family protein [Tenuifilum sp.]